MKPNSVLEAALGYHESGFSVIPVNRETKVSLVPWRWYQKKPPDAGLIQEWFTVRFPDASVAVLTGGVSNVVVVDCDVKKMSPEAMETFLKEHPTPWVVRTGGGGLHYYYAHPGGSVDNRVIKGWVDVRGDGGYVVAPPSGHPSGNGYTWVKRGGSPRKLPKFDPEWVGRPVEATAKADEFVMPAAADDKWLSEIMDGVGEGGRNDATARLSGYYFGRGMAYDVVLTLMEQWNERNKPPIPIRELLRTIKSVWETHVRNGGKVRESSYTKKSSSPPLAPGQDPFAIMPLSEYMVAHGSSAVTWTVDEWLPDKTIAMVVAPPGTYKTWVTFDLAISIATGTRFLKRYPVHNPGPVVIVQQEDFHGQIAERLATIMRDRQTFGVTQSGNGDYTFTPPLDMPLYLHPDRRLRFHDDVVMDALEKTVSTIKPRLVIIDPLYSAGDTDDYMAGTVQSMFRLKDMRDRYGCSFLLAHHTKKSAEGTLREGLWGSQFLNAFLETGWQLRRRDTEGEIVVRRHFKVSQNSPEEIVTFDISTSEPVRYDPRVREPKQAETEKPGVLDVLTQLGACLESEIVKRTDRTPYEVKKLLRNLTLVGAVRMDAVTKRWEIVVKGDDL